MLAALAEVTLFFLGVVDGAGVTAGGGAWTLPPAGVSSGVSSGCTPIMTFERLFYDISASVHT